MSVQGLVMAPAAGFACRASGVCPAEGGDPAGRSAGADRPLQGER